MNQKNADIILADGFEEMEAIAPIDLLRRAGIRVTVIGLTRSVVTGSHNIRVKTEALFSASRPLPDALILPGGPGHKNLLKSRAVLATVKRTFEAGKLCAAICAAPVVLGKAGILTGRKATCFPGEESGLAGALFVEDAVVVDKNIITSRGAGTAVPFALEVVAYLAGRKSAAKLARAIVYR